MDAHLEKIIADYYDGQLSDEDTIEAEKLLLEDDEARAYLDELSAITEFVSILPNEKAPSTLAASISDSIKEETIEPTRAVSMPTQDKAQTPWKSILVAASVLVAFTVISLRSNEMEFTTINSLASNEIKSDAMTKEVLEDDFSVLSAIDSYDAVIAENIEQEITEENSAEEIATPVIEDIKEDKFLAEVVEVKEEVSSAVAVLSENIEDEIKTNLRDETRRTKPSTLGIDDNEKTAFSHASKLLENAKTKVASERSDSVLDRLDRILDEETDSTPTVAQADKNTVRKTKEVVGHSTDADLADAKVLAQTLSTSNKVGVNAIAKPSTEIASLSPNSAKLKGRKLKVKTSSTSSAIRARSVSKTKITPVKVEKKKENWMLTRRGVRDSSAEKLNTSTSGAVAQQDVLRLEADKVKVATTKQRVQKIEEPQVPKAGEMLRDKDLKDKYAARTPKAKKTAETELIKAIGLVDDLAPASPEPKKIAVKKLPPIVEAKPVSAEALKRVLDEIASNNKPVALIAPSMPKAKKEPTKALTIKAPVKVVLAKPTKRIVKKVTHAPVIKIKPEGFTADVMNVLAEVKAKEKKVVIKEKLVAKKVVMPKKVVKEKLVAKKVVMLKKLVKEKLVAKKVIMPKRVVKEKAIVLPKQKAPEAKKSTKYRNKAIGRAPFLDVAITLSKTQNVDIVAAFLERHKAININIVSENAVDSRMPVKVFEVLQKNKALPNYDLKLPKNATDALLHIRILIK